MGSDSDELGDFSDYGDSSESESESESESPETEIAEQAEEPETTERGEGFDPRENPLDIDPVPGRWDLCFDRAKPGARVYVVDVLASTPEEYRENYPNAPALDEFDGNVLVRMRPDDRVLAAIYVKDSLTSTDYTAYPMPESRLTRLPAEEASLIGESDAEFSRPPEDGHRLLGAEPAQPTEEETEGES